MSEKPEKQDAVSIVRNQEFGQSILPEELRRHLQALDAAALKLTGLLNFTTPLRAMLAADDQGKYGTAIEQLPSALHRTAREHIEAALNPSGTPSLMSMVEGLTGEIQRLNDYIMVQNEMIYLQVGNLEAALFGVTKIKIS